MTGGGIAPPSASRVGRAGARPDAYLGQDEGMGAMPSEVRAAFEAFPEEAARLLLAVRATLFATAREAGVGPLTETLKGGQPAYLTKATRAGTTVRLALDAGRPAVLVPCRTTLVDGFRADFPEAFAYGGSRALYLAEGFDRAILAICLARALTYHRKKKEAGA